MGISSVGCRVCGKPCKKSHGPHASKFCSQRCYHKSRIGQPSRIPRDVLLKAQKRGTRRAAHFNRGRQQSPEHKRKRFAAMYRTLAKTPKICPKCHDSFIRTTAGQRFCSGRCWLAAQRRRRGRQKESKRFRLRAQEHYNFLLAQQKNRCAICGVLSGANKRKERLSMDHIHGTTIIRGLLCHACNTGLGLFRDNIGLLMRAQTYLKSHRGLRIERSA
jgi:Recombination endonuclease VII